MRDHQWRLTYPGTDLLFGSGADEVFNLTAPDLGDVDIRSADAERPRADGLSFGTDYRGGRTITFDLGIRGTDETAARAALGRLTSAWKADAVRSVPGATAELQMAYGGHERAVLGRPRRFAAHLQDAKTGFIAVTADFLASDDLFYSTAYSQADVSIVPPPGGGLTAPLSAPLTTSTSSDRSQGFTVGGDLPAWPVVTLRGPITNPVVEVVGLWRLELSGSFSEDDTVVINTEPWARTVLRNGTASVAGKLARRSVRLSKAAVPPGTYELVLRGTSATGTASASLRWRTTYPTP